MSSSVLRSAIDWSRASGADSIVLHHFGEPLLHPELRSRLRQISQSGLRIQFSTNGLLLDSHWQLLTSLQVPVRVMIAFHQWAHEGPSAYEEVLTSFVRRAAGTTVEVVPAYGFKQRTFAVHRWTAGKEEPWSASECPFIKYNLVVILFDGRIASCCADHEGVTSSGNILDPPAYRRSTAWSACSTCDVGRLLRGEVY